MIETPRIFRPFAALILMALCLPLFGADDNDASGGAATRNAGFFERNYVLTELMVMPILALILAGVMASDTTTERIETKHYSWWNRPQGRSYTEIPVPKQPSSPSEIKNTLIVMGVIYLALRLTCLSGFFSSAFQLLGSLIDLLFR